MNIGLLKENHDNRVAMLPEIVQQLVKMQVQVSVESGAGTKASVPDKLYTEAGATVTSRDSVLGSDVVISIQAIDDTEIKRLKKGATYIAVLQPLFSPARVTTLEQAGVSSLSLDIIPRTTRAQAMDILSSQATVSGYKAVLLAATHLPKFFPMFMTAAGTITPSKVLILGAGVAGLQAISTAKRLGAVVEAFDTRKAAGEDVRSLGAKFVEVEGAVDSAAAGGYAVEQSEDFIRRQKQLIHDHAVKSDVIITTAQIPGKPAPRLLENDTVLAMKPGSVIVDLAAATGGNCALTKNDAVITTENGVIIIGNSNLPSTLPQDASKMFGKNVLNLLKLLVTKEGNWNINMDDDIIKGCCVTLNGEVVNERLRAAIPQSV